MESALETLGLSRNEAKIYVMLLDIARSSVTTVSKKTGIHRRNVYDSINRLIDRGLVFQVFSKDENLFEAVNPDKLMELLQEKEQQLESVLPELRSKYEKEPTEDAVFIYHGVQGFKNYMRDVLQTNEEVFSIGAKGFWFDPRLRSFTEGFLKEAKKSKIKFNHLFDFEMREAMPDILELIPGKHRFLPEGYSTQVITNIFGNRVVTFTGVGLAELDREISLNITINSKIADGYRKWFQLLWDNALKE